MADQIPTRYGPLNRILAAGIRQIIEMMAWPALIALTEVHMTLRDIGAASGVGKGKLELPFARWGRFMIEIFGPDEGYLLDTELDPDAAEKMAQEMIELYGSGPWLAVSDSAFAVPAIQRSVSVFLSAEADRLLTHPACPPPAQARTSVPGLEHTSTSALDRASLLNHWADAGKWDAVGVCAFLASKDREQIAATWLTDPLRTRHSAHFRDRWHGEHAPAPARQSPEDVFEPTSAERTDDWDGNAEIETFVRPRQRRPSSSVAVAAAAIVADVVVIAFASVTLLSSPTMIAVAGAVVALVYALSRLVGDILVQKSQHETGDHHRGYVSRSLAHRG
ncbi:hypothetical protein ACTD5D_40840 [Nocardia takedensis]|uniref:hypothetical protein n=1 Tax=Nocardia takedensis TaxID=259390 RepID=UPI003F774D3E